MAGIVVEKLKHLTLSSPNFKESAIFNINLRYVCRISARETALIRCEGCFKISYCSEEHQRIHRGNHEEFCKVIQQVETLVPENNLEELTNWYMYREEFYFYCLQKMNRPLCANESFMILYPGRCEICRSREAHIVCRACLNANYCSEDHQVFDKKHLKLCQNLKFMMDTNVFYTENINVERCIGIR